MQKVEEKTSTSAQNEVMTKREPFFTKEGQGSFFPGSNQTTGSFFRNQSVQAKLSIGKPNDPYEVEADAMADQVLNKLGSSRNIQGNSSGPTGLQRKCSDCEKEEEVSENPEVQLTEHTKLQTKSEGTPNSVSPKLENQLTKSKGGGRPLSSETQSDMGAAFEADFRNVRIHTNQDAIEMNEALNAHAFTQGNDIFFNRGKYDTNSSSGKHLLAHELTHVIQQNSLGNTLLQKDDKDKKAATKKKTASSGPKLKLIPSINGPAKACLIVVHNDEENSRKTAELMHKHCSYNLILLEPDYGKRRIKVPGQGTKLVKQKGKKKKVRVPVTHDPNALFPQEVAEKCLTSEKECKKFLVDKKDSTDKDEMLEYTQIQFFLTVKKGSKNFSIPVVALHNNSIDDTASYMKSKKDKSGFKGTEIDKTTKDKGKAQMKSLKDKLVEKFGGNTKKSLDQSGKTNIFRWCLSNDLVKCHIGLPEDPDKVVWVTNKSDFKKLKGKNINVVLESQETKSSSSESKGDLSTLFIILKKISEKTQSDIELQKKGLDTEVNNFKKMLKSIISTGFSDLFKLPVEIIRIIKKSFEILFGLLQIGLKQLGALDQSKLRYINIETPVDKIKDLSDKGRKDNYEYIAETLKAAGLHHCDTGTKGEESIKKGLELDK